VQPLPAPRRHRHGTGTPAGTGVLYAPGRTPVLVTVPDFLFLMIDGRGDPTTSPEYAQAVAALYAVSYTVKFELKRAHQGLDYRVLPLEGLWWAADMLAFPIEDRAKWDWTMMIRQPELVHPELVDESARVVAARRSLPAALRLRLERFDEGPAAQLMHVGPFSTEGPTIERLHAFIAAQGYQPAGKHHEIYLGDPRRTAPERLKTVLRQPVAPAP
jgi:hypothetical protein